MATSGSVDHAFPLRSRLSLAPHRLLRLKTGNLAVLAERNTGWCLMNAGGYEEVSASFGPLGRHARDFSPTTRPLLDQLWNAGLLLADSAPHPDTVFRPSAYPSSLLLKLTGACNLECTYCYDYDAQRFQARMEYDRARETIQFLLEHRDELSLVFHGGEPLLRFDLLKRIVAFAIDAAGSRARLHFAIQTNATLFTPEIVSFLESHRFSVGISLDGIDDHSNSLRVYRQGRGSLEQVTTLIERYAEFVRERCGFLAVASKRSAPRVPDFALWLQSQDIRSLTVTFLDLAGRGLDQQAEKLTPEDAVALYTRLLSLVRSGQIERLSLRCLISRIDNLFTFQPRDFCHKGPCAAAGDFLVLEAEGSLRTCDCIYDPYFVLANATDTLDHIADHPARHAIEERHVWLREHGTDCRTCPLFGLCGGTCVAKAIANHATPLSVDPNECALTQYLYPELLAELDAEGAKPLFEYYQRHRLPTAAPV